MCLEETHFLLPKRRWQYSTSSLNTAVYLLHKSTTCFGITLAIIKLSRRTKRQHSEYRPCTLTAALAHAAAATYSTVLAPAQPHLHMLLLLPHTVPSLHQHSRTCTCCCCHIQYRPCTLTAALAHAAAAAATYSTVLAPAQPHLHMLLLPHTVPSLHPHSRTCTCCCCHTHHYVTHTT